MDSYFHNLSEDAIAFHIEEEGEYSDQEEEPIKTKNPTPFSVDLIETVNSISYCLIESCTRDRDSLKFENLNQQQLREVYLKWVDEYTRDFLETVRPYCLAYLRHRYNIGGLPFKDFQLHKHVDQCLRISISEHDYMN
jgi:hypothetical protein